jgi:hypothetical protein
MKLRPIAALLGLLFACLWLAPAARAADDPLSFDDPGMHFKAPDGWERFPLQESGENPGGQAGSAPIAVWGFHVGKGDQRVISIVIRSSDEGLETIERQHEADLRDQGDGVFIDKHELTKLENGMPAYWVRSSSGTDAGKFYRRYEWVVFDGKRSIFVTLLGKQGDFDDAYAKAALKSLYVVAYPGARP